MILTTLGHLVEVLPALQRIAHLRLPVKAAYRIARILKAIATEVRTFEEQRNALIQAHGTEQSPDVFEVDVDKRAAYFAAIKELAAIEVTLGHEPVAIALEHLATGELSPADLLAVERFLTVTE